MRLVVKIKIWDVSVCSKCTRIFFLVSDGSDASMGYMLNSFSFLPGSKEMKIVGSIVDDLEVCEIVVLRSSLR